MEPGWLFADGGQKFMLGLANLRLNVEDSLLTADFSVSVQGQNCKCNDKIDSDGTIDVLTCFSPAFKSNTTSASVQLQYRGIALFSGTVAVNGLLPQFSSLELSAGTNNWGPVVTFLNSPVQQGNSFLKTNFPQTVLLYGTQSRLFFELFGPEDAYLRPVDIEVKLKPSAFTSCTSLANADCLHFQGTFYNISNIVVQVSTKALLRANGILSLNSCPELFCGVGGWSVSFDAILFIKGEKIAERLNALRIIPSNSFVAENVSPSTIPAKRSFTITVTINRYWNKSTGPDFQVEFRDVNGTLRTGLVQKVSEVYGSDLLGVEVLVPALSAGPVLGRFFFPGNLYQRSTTMCTFGIMCLDDPPGPASVVSASTTRGPANGGTVVNLRVTNFPMIMSISQVTFVPY